MIERRLYFADYIARCYLINDTICVCLSSLKYTVIFVVDELIDSVVSKCCKGTLLRYSFSCGSLNVVITCKYSMIATSIGFELLLDSMCVGLLFACSLS